MQLIEGQATVTVSRKELQTLVYISPQEQRSPDITLTSGTLSVEANVTETLTGITLSGKNSVPLTTDKYKLEILDITPNTFKPHLMYYGFVSKILSIILFLLCIYNNTMHLQVNYKQ